MGWFSDLRNIRRTRRARPDSQATPLMDTPAVFETYKPLPALPGSDVSFMCTIGRYEKVKIDTGTNLFKPKRMLFEGKTLITIPAECSYEEAMAAIEAEAVKVFSANKVSNDVLSGKGKADIGKLWRAEALVKAGQEKLMEGVLLCAENWERALRMLVQGGREVVVAFYEPRKEENGEEDCWVQ